MSGEYHTRHTAPHHHQAQKVSRSLWNAAGPWRSVELMPGPRSRSRSPYYVCGPGQGRVLVCFRGGTVGGVRWLACDSDTLST